MDASGPGRQPPPGCPEDLREQVVAAVARHVLPYVNNHGGHLTVEDVSPDGTVTCRLHGACLGCPSAAVTLLAVVEGALRAEVGDALRVQSPQFAVSAAAATRIRAFYGPRAGRRARPGADAGA